MDETPLFSDMKDRIKQLMATQHMTQQSFSDVLGISPASLSSIFNDRTKPTLNHVEAIKKRFPSINTDWILFGNGPMFNDSEHDDSEKTLQEPSSMPKEQSLDFSVSTALEDRNSLRRDQTSKLDSTVGAQIKPVIQYIDKPQRKVTEIRIFYDDQTWETFVPSK
jgi:transcriptional regulator with XRE-family HTH domain